jgi:hypothetical protein
MLPTVIRLGAIKLAKSAANDAGRALVARDIKGRFTPLSNAVANDKVDFTAKTLERMMARHNGHDGPLREAANAPTAYEKTMDRIMQRHNGHDGLTGEPSNDTKNRIFHDPAGPLAQARPTRNWEPYTETPLLLRKKYREGDSENETESGSKSRGTRDNSILKKIEKNTEKSTKLLQEIANSMKDSRDGMGVDSLRAKEMDLENRQGNRPWDRNRFLDALQDNSEKDDLRKKWEKAQAIKALKGDSVAALAFLAGGAALQAIGNDDADKKQNRDAPGGGHTSKQQKSTRRSNDPRRTGKAPAPRAAPKPDAIPQTNNSPYANAPTEISSDQLSDREKAFVKMVMDSEGAPSPDTTFGMNKHGKSRFVTPEEMYGGRHLSDLSVNEVRQFQDRLTRETKNAGIGKSNGKIVGTSAVGIGQFVQSTMVGTLKQMGYTDKDFETLKLDKDLQARMIVHILANKRKLSLKEIDKWSDKDLDALGKEWESLDVSKGKISKDELKRRLKEVARFDPTKTSSGMTKPNGKRLDGSDIYMSDESLKKLKPGDAAEIKKIFAQQAKKGPTTGSAGQGAVTVHVNNHSKSTPAPKTTQKRRVPPSKPSQSWSDLAKKYFGW